MDTQSLISTLTWLLIAAAAGLLGSIIWFAKRIVAQLDRMEKAFLEDRAAMDKRVTRLEDWREVVGVMLRAGPKGTG